MMETKNGFTRFDNINEFKTWINKQNIRRKTLTHHLMKIGQKMN